MKINKKLTIIFSALPVTGTILLVIFVLSWNGAFNKLDIRNITSYENNGYTLSFQQIGEPQWSFGPTYVRLLLKDQQGKILEKYDTSIQDDGANAGERNIASVEWFDDKVIVVLQASEMEDREIIIPYKIE